MAVPQFIDFVSALGARLQCTGVDGREALSSLFEYEVSVVDTSEQPLAFEALLGKPAEVVLGLGGRNKRHLHGLVTAVSYLDHVDKLARYTVTLRPALWLLTRSTNVRFFDQKKVPEIVKQLMEGSSVTVVDRLSATYETRSYCVQYRETDFDFISRLMEDEGIYYFFEHGPGRHSLVLADSASAHAQALRLGQLPFHGDEPTDESVLKWTWGEEVRTAKVALRDRSFTNPKQIAQGDASASRPHGLNSTVHYDAPAGAPGAAIGDEGTTQHLQAMARVRLTALQTGAVTIEGSTNSLRLCNGARFSLTNHPVSAQNTAHVVCATQIRIRHGGYRSGEELDFSCGFTAFPADRAFAPPRLAPRPRIAGPQTALVVGPAGEEIHVDKHGRVKLQFYWDRESTNTGDTTCWVRVAQPAAGKGFGFVFLPRIGQEVVVDFLDGDPDQPLVTGSVYNAAEIPPYALPDKKTVSTIKSRSTKGGGTADFNELRFDDLKGSEYLFLQAQKDKLEIVKETARTQIGKEQHLLVKDKRLEKVEGEYHLGVVKDHRVKVDGKFSQKVAKDMLLATDGQHSLKAAKDITAESGTAYSIKAGTDLHAKTGMNIGMEAGMAVHLKGGMNVVIEAGMMLTLKAGSSSVVIGPAGVSITGAPLVMINSGGAAGSGSGAKPVAPTAPEAATDPTAPVDPLA